MQHYKPYLMKMTRKQKSDARRDQILDAALELFSRKGFAESTTCELAERLGVASGLLYHYFDSKLDLLKAVIERHGFLPRLREMLTPVPDEATDVVLLRIARAWWSLLEEKRMFVLMVFGESQRSPELTQLMGAMVKEGSRLVSRYLASRARRGELRASAQFDVAARMFLNAIFMFFVQQSRMSPPLRRIAPETYFRECVQIMRGGLAAAGIPTRRRSR